MTITQLKERELEIQRIHDRSIESLHQEFIDANAKFKVGDLVRNVTGIIRIESIRYDRYSDTGVSYCGVKQRRVGDSGFEPVGKPRVCLTEPLQKIELH